MIEKRQTIRFPHEHKIAYCATHDLLPRTGRLSNISREGACLQTREPFEVNQRLTLSVPNDLTQQALTVTGSVRWQYSADKKRRQYTIGVEWLPLDQRSNSMLTELIRWKTEQTPSERNAWKYADFARRLKTLKPGGLLALALFLISYGAVLALFASWQQEKLYFAQTGYEMKKALYRAESYRVELKLIEAAQLIETLSISSEDSAQKLSAIGDQLKALEDAVVDLKDVTTATEAQNQTLESRKSEFEEQLGTLKELLAD